jgi:hypothetical protein
MPISYQEFPHRDRLVRLLTLAEKDGGNTEYSYDLMLDPETGQYYLKHWREYAVTYSYHFTHELYSIEEAEKAYPAYYEQSMEFLRKRQDQSE